MSSVPVAAPVAPVAPPALQVIEDVIVYDPNALLQMSTEQLLVQLIALQHRKHPEAEQELKKQQVAQLATDWIMEKVAIFRAEGLNDFADKLMGLI